MRKVFHHLHVYQEERLLYREGGIPIVEVLSEKPKTLSELQQNIEALHDTQASAEELNQTLAALNEAQLEALNTNLQELQNRAQMVGPILARLDLKGLIQATAPQVPVASPEVAEVSSNPRISSDALASTNNPLEILESVKKDFVEGSAVTKASYLAGAGIGFLGARWLWRKVFGDQEHEGVLKKTGKWLLSALAAVGGAIGISSIKNWWNKNAVAPWSSFTNLTQGFTSLFSSNHSQNPGAPGTSPDGSILDVPAQALNAGRDISQGAGRSFDDLILDPARGVIEVVKPLMEGDPQKALEVALENGYHLFVNDQGEIVVQDTLFKPLTAPLRATYNLATEEGRNSENFWVVWGEAGGAYLIGNKAIEAWRTGKLPIPTTMKGIVADALRIASGPLQSVYDGARILIFATQKDGLAAMRIRHTTLSALGRMNLSHANSIFSQAIRNENSALRMLSRYQRLVEDLRIMKNFRAANGFLSFNESELELVEKVINNTVDSVKKYLQTAEGLQSEFLVTLKAKISHMTEIDELRKEMSVVFNAFRGNVHAGVPQIASIADTASLADEVVDSTRAADAVTDSLDVLPMIRPQTIPTSPVPDTGLARAAGDGVVSPQPAVRVAEAADESSAGLRVVRETGEVIDPATGRVVEQIADATTAVASGAPDAAVSTIRTAESITPVLREYAPVKQLLTGARAEQYAQLLASAEQSHGVSGGKNVARYLLSLSEDIDDTRRAAMLAPEAIQLIAEGRSGNPVAIARTLSVIKQTEGVFDAARSIRQLSAWQSSGRLGRSLQAFGIAAEAVMVGVDVYSLVQSYEHREEHRQALVKGLEDAGLTSTDGETYTGFGIEVSISQLQTADVERYATLTATDTAALGAGLAATFLPLGASAGPVGLAVAGVAIAVNYSVNQIFTAFDQREQQEFLSKAPQWLLGMLRTSTLLNKSEHGLIREFNGVMTQDIWPADWKELILGKQIATLGTMQQPENREAIRNKLLQSLCYQALLGKYADLAGEIPGMASIRDFYGPESQFLKAGGDFETIVKPYITLRLHSMTEGEQVSFAETQRLNLSDNLGSGISAWWNDIPTLSEHDLTRAVEESMLFYIHHLREVQFREQRTQIEQLLEREQKRLTSLGTRDPELTEKLALARAAYEEMLRDEIDATKDRSYVFNQNPFTLQLRADGKTIAETILADKIDRTRKASDTYSAELAGTRWSLPGSEREGDIRWFTSEYVTPQFLPATHGYLRERSPERDAPLSFDQLEEMGKTQTEFVRAFVNHVRPIREMNSRLSEGFTRDEDLKAFVQRHEATITLAESFYRREQYYRTYLTDWRQVSSSILPESKMSFLRILKSWKESGYPPLLDEQKFKQAQESLRSRPQENSPVQPFGLSIVETPAVTRRASERLRLSGGIPGYEPGSMLLGLQQYSDILQSQSISQLQRFDRGPEILLGPRRDSLTLSRDLFRPSLSAPQFTPAQTAALISLRPLQELSKLGLITPSLRTQAEHLEQAQLFGREDIVAVKPEELPALLQSLSSSTLSQTQPLRITIAPEPSQSESLLPASDFSLLQLYLLQSRVFILGPNSISATR